MGNLSYIFPTGEILPETLNNIHCGVFKFQPVSSILRLGLFFNGLFLIFYDIDPRCSNINFLIKMKKGVRKNEAKPNL